MKMIIASILIIFLLKIFILQLNLDFYAFQKRKTFKNEIFMKFKH